MTLMSDNPAHICAAATRRLRVWEVHAVAEVDAEALVATPGALGADHPEIDPVQSQASNAYIPLLTSPLGERSIGLIEAELTK